MPASHGQSTPPGPTAMADERSTGSLLPPADSTRDVAQEDFLFHLYRGSELLQENRVLEAKEELEFALTMQPLDAKGQDLLGAVYFRLGLYPHAIQIYEALEKQFPKDTSIKINLALGYLKTGQAALARRPLEDAVRLQPEHKRAWGYLGLALQKLGELEQAHAAFERGGHVMMARRVTERRRQSLPPPEFPVPPQVDARVREMAEVAFSELDAGELRFALADGGSVRPGDGPWVALELGMQAIHEVATVPRRTRPVPPAAHSSTRSRKDILSAAPPLLNAGSDAAVAVLESNVLLVRTREHHEHPTGGFAGRLDALRVVSGTATTRVLHRRDNGSETNEVIGGLGSPVVRITGDAECVLGAKAGHHAVLMALDDDLASVREDRLLGFDLRLAYECARLALEHPDEGVRPPGEGIPIVQLRGSGSIVLELRGKLTSLAAIEGTPLLVRREWVAGWIGPLVVRSVPPAEAPGGQRGLFGFSGEGFVLLCAE